MRRPKPRADRWLTLLQVAERLDLTEKTPAERRRIVRRLFRKLEQQHHRKFLRSWGTGGEGSRLYVSLEAIELAMPWNPGPIGEMRSEVDGHAHRIRKLEDGQTEHARKIKRLVEFQRRAAELLADIGRE